MFRHTAVGTFVNKKTEYEKLTVEVYYIDTAYGGQMVTVNSNYLLW